MSRRVLAALAALAMMTAVLLLVLAPDTGPTSSLSFVPIAEAAHGQGAQVSSSDAKSRVAAKPWTPPRTPWGHPDLQGVWDYRTITPLERPGAFSGKQLLTDEEAASVLRTGPSRRGPGVPSVTTAASGAAAATRASQHRPAAPPAECPIHASGAPSVSSRTRATNVGVSFRTQSSNVQAPRRGSRALSP